MTNLHVSTHDKRTQPKTRPGELIFIIAFLLFALFLLSQIGAETKFSARGKLFAQPRFWPALSIIGVVLFGLTHLLASLSHRSSIITRGNGAISELLTWVRALEYLLWFLIYVRVVPVTGYLPATVLFTVLLAYRQGYRTKKQLFTAAAMGVGIVLIFKTVLSVRIPGGTMYEYLPDALRNFAIVYF